MAKGSNSSKAMALLTASTIKPTMPIAATLPTRRPRNTSSTLSQTNSTANNSTDSSSTDNNSKATANSSTSKAMISSQVNTVSLADLVVLQTASVASALHS